MIFYHIHRSLEGVRSPQYRLYLRRHHIQIEGFLNKLVPAHIHSHNNVHIVISRRQEYDRHLRNLPDLLAPVKSIKKRKHNIQQDKLRIKLLKQFPYILKILCTPHLIIPFPKMGS